MNTSSLNVIVRNEFMDHVTNNVFLMSFAILFTTMVCSTYYQIVVFQKNVVLLEYYGMLGDNVWMELNSGVVGRMISILSTVGALVAVSISFNSFEKGRVEGSLRVLLTYPLYRDTIVLGKILAGVLVLFIVTLTSMSVSFVLFLFYCTVPLFLPRVGHICLYFEQEFRCHLIDLIHGHKYPGYRGAECFWEHYV